MSFLFITIQKSDCPNQLDGLTKCPELIAQDFMNQNHLNYLFLIVPYKKIYNSEVKNLKICIVEIISPWELED